MALEARAGVALARWLLPCLFLAACAARPPAPIEERGPRLTASVPAVYQVQRGDTLYSIAWRYGLDHRVLAARNAVAAPYLIYPGQRLRLTGRIPARPAPRETVSRAKPQPAREPPERTARAPSPPPSPRPSQPAQVPAQVGAWRWPADGAILRGYGAATHKGIDIGGQRGDPVVAAASGSVVYAGTGIAGLGALLIVKHSPQFLSAYGHNERLLVKEGDAVRAGQRIALKGDSGTDGVRLHFEIRKDGRPVDPGQILPPRR